MEEDFIKINITNNQGNKKDTVMLWNSGRCREYWEEVDRVLANPLVYYGDLSGRVYGGGHYGNTLDSVILKVKNIVEIFKDECMPVILTSKIEGENKYEGCLKNEELNYILDKISDNYENIFLANDS